MGLLLLWSLAVSFRKTALNSDMDFFFMILYMGMGGGGGGTLILHRFYDFIAQGARADNLG